MGGTDTGVPPRGKPIRRLFRHKPEPPEEQQRQVGTTSRHAPTVPTLPCIDNQVAYLSRL
jgi:hypothetical protein